MQESKSVFKSRISQADAPVVLKTAGKGNYTTAHTMSHVALFSKGKQTNSRTLHKKAGTRSD